MKAGSVPTDMLSTAFFHLDRIVSAALAKKKAHNAKGHQRTPAFIYEALIAAIQDSNGGVVDSHYKSEVMARGGTTDVGKHTGSKPRDTSWPLVQQVFLVSFLVHVTCNDRDLKVWHYILISICT